MAKTYTTMSGDTWDRISREVYGSESYTSFLMANNQDKLDTFVFSAGENLSLRIFLKKRKFYQIGGHNGTP